MNSRVWPSTGILSALSYTTNGNVALNLSISKREQALASLDGLKIVLENLSTDTASLGAAQSRLDVQFRTLESQRENYLMAESRIRDTDIAEESSRLTANQILQQSSASVLAQANQQPRLVLQFLEGLSIE